MSRNTYTSTSSTYNNAIIKHNKALTKVGRKGDDIDICKQWKERRKKNRAREGKTGRMRMGMGMEMGMMMMRGRRKDTEVGF